jgi:hypothetical protein
MNYISTLVIALILVWGSQGYSQSLVYTNSKQDKAKIRENSKKLRLKVSDLKTVDKNGKTSWQVNSTLTNNSRDTLFYFTTADCESGNFIAMATVDTISLFADIDPCNISNQTVVAIPPKEQRTVNLLISSERPVTSSMTFMVCLHIYKAENMNERIPHDVLYRGGKKDVNASW